MSEIAVRGELSIKRGERVSEHEATKTNGVYLLMIKSEREGYTVRADGEPTVVTDLRLNGHQFSLNGRAELEVTDVNFRSDDTGGVTLDLQLDGPSVQSAAPGGTDGGEQ